MTTTMRMSHVPSSPTTDGAELQWAAIEIASLLRQSEPGSVVGAVLQQTLRELSSLKSSTGTVVGPFRMKAA